MNRRWLSVVALLAACGGEETTGSTRDASTDLDRGIVLDAMPMPSDAMLDAASDAGPMPSDAVSDAMPDARVDAFGDAMPAALDADASPDALPPDDCDRALVASPVGGDPIELFDFGRAAARGPSLTAEIELTNVCARRLRFLGHPDDWLEGAAFALDALPPIQLEPGQGTVIGLRFGPDAAGLANGRLTLPYDRPGAPLVVELRAEVVGPRRVVFVGDGRHVVTTADHGASVAADGFETLEAHGDALQRGVCWGAGRFVAVGGNVDSRWWTSVDGVEWQAHSADTPVMAGCAYGAGRFVTAAGRPMHSVDGIEWVSGRDDGFVPQHLRAMTFGGGVFVAVGDEGRVVSTVDGTGWDTDAVLGIGGLTAVTWGGGRFVAVGQGGATASSRDGVQWATGLIPEAGDLGGVAWAGGEFVAGDGGRIFASDDGLDWRPVNAAPAVPRVGHGRMIFGSSGGRLFRSEDGGFSWTEWHVSAGGLGLSAAAVEGL